MTPTPSGDCFATWEELNDAIDSYIRDNSSNSSTAQKYGRPIGTWCVSQIVDFSRLFKDKRFNEDLSGWDTSRATTMANMFDGAIIFNQDLSSWDTSSVGDMSSMFEDAHAFEGMGISGWDVGRVGTMAKMFHKASSFDADLLWNTASVVDMSEMFHLAVSFDRGLPWDTSK